MLQQQQRHMDVCVQCALKEVDDGHYNNDNDDGSKTNRHIRTHMDTLHEVMLVITCSSGGVVDDWIFRLSYEIIADECCVCVCVYYV